MKYRTLPEVLAVQLNRYGMGAGARRQKCEAHVPLEEELDMAGCADTPRPAHTAYRLRAVVQHDGKTLGKGHYICWVRDRAAPTAAGMSSRATASTWTQYNDGTVSPPCEELPEKTEKEAYILYYERLDAGAASPARPLRSPERESDEERGSAPTPGPNWGPPLERRPPSPQRNTTEDEDSDTPMEDA